MAVIQCWITADLPTKPNSVYGVNRLVAQSRKQGEPSNPDGPVWLANQLDKIEDLDPLMLSKRFAIPSETVPS